MDKMKVNKQQTMKEKGNCSSSHYRNNSGISEVATKFVTWETNPLECLTESKVYKLRVKLNKGGLMSREEKNWLAEAVNSITATSAPPRFKSTDLTSLMSSRSISSISMAVG